MFGVEWMAAAAQGQGGGLSILGGMGGEAAYRLGMSRRTASYIHHQWYRLITAMFLHGGLIHIGFNMMSLIAAGPALEEALRIVALFFPVHFHGAFVFSSAPFWARTRWGPAADSSDWSARCWRSPPNAAALTCVSCARA